jgi:hypothetical protein
MRVRLPEHLAVLGLEILIRLLAGRDQVVTEVDAIEAEILGKFRDGNDLIEFDERE